MPYCSNCGKPINETDRFCPSCGVELGKAAPLEGERRFPTPLPDYTRTRLLTSDNTDHKRDYGKTRLIDYDKEESGPTPVSGKTRLIDDSNKEGLVAEDIPPSKSFPQQTESFKTRLISDSERPGTSKAAGIEVSIAKIDLVEFEIARMNARKYKKARNTWLILAIIFFCATGAFVPLYVVADDEARHLRWDYNDIRQELITAKEDYETQLGIKQVEYEELKQDYRNLEKNYIELKSSNSESPVPAPSPTKQVKQNVVKILDGSFSPSYIEVNEGGEVTWLNAGSLPRILYFIDLESPIIGPGQEFTRSFETAGLVYTYLGEPWSATFKGVVSVVCE